MVYYCSLFPQGHVAERLGKGLQNLLRRFNSAHDLCDQLDEMAVVYGVYFHIPLYISEHPGVMKDHIFSPLK